MIADAKQAIADGRPIIIFPEGTRRPLGAEPDYKPGVAALYGALDVPCVPIAHNSGLYWPRRGFLRKPGKIIVEVLPPIQPGLKRAAFMAELQRRLEEATARLLREGGFQGALATPAAAGA
jgi:1-acyl-sn-glycerol-3-phosphate acyltransferase